MLVAEVGGSRPAAPPPADTRPDLRAIERNYQASDDKVETWSPSLFGMIPLGGLGGSRELTATEGKLLDNLTRDRGLLGLKAFSDIADQAFSVSADRVPPPTTLPGSVERQIAALPADQQDVARRAWPSNDGHTDAFRHAYWNATLTAEFGESWTAQFTTAHEGLPGNSAMREAMDLYNNEVGRQIATDNPDASREELGDLVLRALDEGKLVVIDRSGHLAWSDDVARGDHGMTPSIAVPGAIGIPRGDASANGS